MNTSHVITSPQTSHIRQYIIKCCFLLSAIVLLILASQTALADGVTDKLNAIRSVYPSDSQFTESGAACATQNNQCSNCELANIPARGGLSSGKAAANVMGNAWTCVGFAKYVFYNTFGVSHNNSNNKVYTSLSDARPGDYVQMWNTSAYGYNTGYITHCAIFAGWNGSTPIWYESNYSVNNRVSYRAYNQGRALYRVIHAYNYDTISGQPSDYQKPSLGTVSVTNVSHNGFTLSVRVTDNVGVTRVQFPTWTPDTSAGGTNQDDLVWHEASKGSDGVTWSCFISTNQHNSEINCRYWSDIYAYDAAGNRAVYSEINNGYVITNIPGADTTSPTITTFSITNITSHGFRVEFSATDNEAVTRLVFRAGVGSHTNGSNVYTYSCQKAGSGYYVWVDTGNHGDRTNCSYFIDCYAYDAAGNSAYRYKDNISIPARDEVLPVITEAGAVRLSPNGFVFSFRATDNTGIQYAQIVIHEPGSNSGGGIATPLDSNGYATYTVLVSDHSYKRGEYEVIVVVEDYDDNREAEAYYVNVPPKPAKPTITVTNDGDGSELYETTISWPKDVNTDSYGISVTKVEGGSAVDYRRSGYVFPETEDTAVTYLLDPGTYEVSVSAQKSYDTLSLNSTGEQWFTADSDKVTFTVSDYIEPNVWATWNEVEGDHKLYVLLGQGFSWLEGKAIADTYRASRASGTGVRMAQIRSQKDQDAMETIAAGYTGGAYLGLFQDYPYNPQRASRPSDLYNWLDDSKGLMTKNSPPAYTNWAVGQPSNPTLSKNCVRMRQDGLWETTNSQSSQTALVLEYDPTAISVQRNVEYIAQGAQLSPDIVTVNVTFGDRTIETHDYDLQLSSDEPGPQTLTVTYGHLSRTIDITVVKSMGEADFILPASLKSIDREAFQGLKMHAVQCPNGLVSIGPGAFADCTNLREIYIPDSVTTISGTAFQGCTNLTIYGEPNSEAQFFANGHGMEFMPILK